MVWNKTVPTRWNMEFHSSKDDTELPGDQSSSLYKNQCAESWNSEISARENFHTFLR